MALGDATCGVIGCVLAYIVWNAGRRAVVIDAWIPLLFGAGWLCALLLVHGYAAIAPRSRLYSAVSVGKAAVPVAVLAFSAYFLEPSVSNRPSLLLSVAIGAVSILVFRVTAARLLLNDVFAMPTVLITEADISSEVRIALDAARFEYRIVEWLPASEGGELETGFQDRLNKAIRRHRPPEMLVGHLPPTQLEAVAQCSVASGIGVRSLSTVLEHYLARVPLDQVNADWLLGLPSGRLMDRPVLLLRRILDVVLAALTSVPLFAITPLVAAAIRLDSPGPSYLRQTRVGQFGREFTLFKFRTMRVDAEAQGAQWSTKSDPRVTRVGRMLRRLRIDEWPQVINVWRGEMSFIGPRPERPEFVQILQRELPHYRARLLVKPGLTGWAQVKAGYASSVSDSARKLEYDLYYVKYRGLRLDMQVLMLSIFVVLGLRGQ
jgi:lipopolysaccharide/colanic/teichoic acid biosynthesis glycosyltransferase